MKSDTFSTCIGVVTSLIVVAVVGTIANGWALATIWNWFIPPLFHVTTLTFVQAIGVSMVFELFTGTNRTKKTESSESKTVGEAIISSLISVILTPVISVGIAWIVLQFAF